MLANNLGQSGHISLTYLVGAGSTAQGYYHHVYYKTFFLLFRFFLRNIPPNLHFLRIIDHEKSPDIIKPKDL